MIVRKFSKEDARKASYLLRKVQREYMIQYYPKRIVEDFYKRNSPAQVIKKAETRDTFVAVEGKRILGINALDGNEIRQYYVNPRYHKKGVGKALMRNIEKIAQRKHIRKLIVKSSINAEGFYKKMGFKRIRKIFDVRGKLRIPEILMEKKL